MEKILEELRKVKCALGTSKHLKKAIALLEKLPQSTND